MIGISMGYEGAGTFVVAFFYDQCEALTMGWRKA